MVRYLGDRETSLVICGLRMLEGYLMGQPAAVDDAFQMILRDEGFADVTAGEVGSLCEEINFGGKAPAP